MNNFGQGGKWRFRQIRDYRQLISYLVPRLRRRAEVDQSEIIKVVIAAEPALHAAVSQDGTGTRLKGRTSHTLFTKLLQKPWARGEELVS